MKLARKLINLVCRPTRSLRELFAIILFVSVISVIVTYQVSKYVLQKEQAEWKIQFNGRVDIYRKFHLEENGDDGTNPDGNHSDKHRGLEGIDLESRSKYHKKSKYIRRPPTALEKKLRQVESSLIDTRSRREKVAVICGDSDTINRDSAIYTQTLKTAGFTVKIGNGTSSSTRCSSLVGRGSSWSLLLCLVDAAADMDALCAAKQLTHLQPHQKVAYKSTVHNLLAQKDNLCHIMTTAQHIPVVKQSQLYPQCFVMPRQFEDFLSLADALGNSANWIFKPLTPGGARVQMLQPTKNRDFLKIKDLSQKEVVVQRFQASPLLLFGMPVSVTAFVLVTSLSPLRAYLHSDGVVQYRHDYQRNFQKILGRTWTLEHFKHHISQTYGKDAAQVAFSNMESAIVQTLLLTEGTIQRPPGEQKLNQLKASSHSSQLLGFDLVFNSSFHPLIVEVSSSPSLYEVSRQGEWEDTNATINSILTDMTSLLYGTTSVASDVARALEELNHHVGIKDLDCQPFHKLCLGSSDVKYALNARREALHRGGFAQLYPSYEADKYSQLMEDVQRFSAGPNSQSLLSITAKQARSKSSSKSHDTSHDGGHVTYDLHSILVSMERYYHNLDAVEDSYDDLNVPLFQEGRSKQGASKLIENIFHNSSHVDKKYTRLECSEDKSLMPYLAGLYTEPSLNVTPKFRAETTEYYATVPYDLFLIKVWAFAQSCDCEARLDDKYGLSRPSNYTLGLGSNRISVMVVDVTHTEPWIINTYTLHIYRRAPGEDLLTFDGSQPHVVCSLTQDCSIPLVPSQPCDLERSYHATWPSYLQHTATLPNCTRGHEPGEWLVPCAECRVRDSCHWRSAVWQPYDCNHPRMPRHTLKQCLAAKQILFIGDSTNRGIMHYLMEQVNDSLTEWDKTHNIKVYNNINHDQTSVSFAYYPQFWLPANQRPVFDKALYQLIKKSQPLENNHNTVLVVGGVHWLATHHLNVLIKGLQREGLSDIRVVVKSLGAGFHQPVDGLHCLTMREHRKLLIHNRGLLDFALKHKFDVVDTFNMTMARYKDFLQGKCACHFHRVREILPSFTQFLQSTSQNGSGKLMDMPISYHVEGDINTAYSEILLNRICDYT